MDANGNSHMDILKPFPDGGDHIVADSTNPAIKLYGRRFYKDQTQVEYLAEFLLVFASPKKNPAEAQERLGDYSFSLPSGGTPGYWAENHIALKLFAFFPSSKLETRHPAHRDAYLEALDVLKDRVSGSAEKKEETVRLLQSLLGGFVGVAKNRTWVTYSFLPASTAFLAKEITWKHPEALRNEVQDWESSRKYFDENTRNFLGRGGELLFLQLTNLFCDPNSNGIKAMLADKSYQHIAGSRLDELAQRVENQLRKLLVAAVDPLTKVAHLVEESLTHYRIDTKYSYSNLGWVPKASCLEALLFAHEIDNLCSAALSPLETLDLLQTLCSLQVLRSLCFQARRVDTAEAATPGFIGGYVWIPSAPDANIESPIRLMAKASFSRIDGMLYRALRSPLLYSDGNSQNPRDLKNGDDNCFRHFRKLTKETGLVVPRKGGGQRFVLTPELLRFLVAALVRPGERIRLTEFYRRAFAHYGLALGGESLAVGLDWCGTAGGKKSYAVAADTAWIEEALQQGGFLVELSDAVSIVHNPGEVKD